MSAAAAVTATTAEHAHLEALLRACALEQALPVGPDLTVPLRRHGLALHAAVEHASATGRHRVGPVSLRRCGDGAVVADPVDPVLAVALVAAELAAPGGTAGDVGELAARAADSVRRVRTLLAHPAPPTDDGFLAAEQAMTLGHLHHPTPKSRDGITDAECLAWAPEAGGRFPLHWFAAEPGVVAGEHLPGTDDPRSLLASFAPEHLRARAGDRVLVPAHPWQARDLLTREPVAALLASGALEPLGPGGPDWWPTSSWRTLYRPDADVMLKCSLGLRLTNSRRESTLTELRRGVEVARLLAAGHTAATTAAHPQFSITPDPSWLAVLADGADGRDVTGLDVAVRAVPDGVAGLRCLAGLVAPAPGGAWLARVVDDPHGWVARYVARVLVPCLHLHASTGIGLEAHQQNVLVRLDAGGDVVGGAYRDNQGYYLAESRLADVLAVTGARTSTLAVVPDALVEDRLSYYLLRNQALAVVGCLGEAGLADERDLLAVVRDELTTALPALAAAGPHGDRLARRWLTAPTLPTKANLATGFSGVDEVLAPLATQSVYLDRDNPLVAR